MKMKPQTGSSSEQTKSSLEIDACHGVVLKQREDTCCSNVGCLYVSLSSHFDENVKHCNNKGDASGLIMSITELINLTNAPSIKQLKEQPDEQPDDQHEEQPNDQPEEQLNNQPDEQPKEQPDEQSEKQPKDQLDDQRNEQPNDQPDEQPNDHPNDHPDEQPEEQPNDQSDERTK